MSLPIFTPADILANVVGRDARTVSGSGTSRGTRAALTFTSDLRRRLSRFDPQSGQRAPASGLSTFSASLKTSFSMGINPASIEFRQPKRIAKVDTREGSVYFHFSNSRGQNHDILVLAFRGSTGNIDLRGSLRDRQLGILLPTKGTDTGALQKLIAWQNLYQLTREPTILPDGTVNKIYITYTSLLFPHSFEFIGFFNEVLNFTESGESPFARDYSFEFTVTETSPDLDDLLEMTTDVLQSLEELEPDPDGSFEVVTLPEGVPGGGT
jgi:hypothetical protein